MHLRVFKNQQQRGNSSFMWCVSSGGGDHGHSSHYVLNNIWLFVISPIPCSGNYLLKPIKHATCCFLLSAFSMHLSCDHQFPNTSFPLCVPEISANFSLYWLCYLFVYIRFKTLLFKCSAYGILKTLCRTKFLFLQVSSSSLRILSSILGHTREHISRNSLVLCFVSNKTLLSPTTRFSFWNTFLVIPVRLWFSVLYFRPSVPRYLTLCTCWILVSLTC